MPASLGRRLILPPFLALLVGLLAGLVAPARPAEAEPVVSSLGTGAGSGGSSNTRSITTTATVPT